MKDIQARHEHWQPHILDTHYKPQTKQSIHNQLEDNNSLLQKQPSFGQELYYCLDHPDHTLLHFSINTLSTNTDSWFGFLLSSPGTPKPINTPTAI